MIFKKQCVRLVKNQREFQEGAGRNARTRGREGYYIVARTDVGP